MESRFVFFSLILTFLLPALVSAASAQERKAGVSVGNTFTYSVIATWSSNNLTAPLPADLIEQNNTQWTRLNVTAVSGVNVTAEMTGHFKNGSEATVSNWVRVDNGSYSAAGTGGGTGLLGFLVSANLTVGDPIYTGAWFTSLIISETAPRAYLSSARDTNHLNHSYSSGDLTTYQHNYYDKLTGVLVEALQTNVTQTGDYTTTSSLHLQIYDSNVWTVVPEFPHWALAMFMFAALTPVILALSKRKQLKTAIH